MSADPTALYSRKNPFPAKLRTNRKLTADGSAKDTRHFEIDLSGSGLAYEVGDSLGVFPTNNPALVQELLSLLGFSGEESVVDTNGQPVTLRKALTRFYVITEMDKKLLAAIAEKDPSAAKFNAMVTPEGKADLDAYLWGREVIDPLLEYPAAKFTAEEFVKCLRKLQPRLYSIASSQKAHSSEVHLTVAAVRYESNGRKREGVCSTFLSDRADSAPVPVFVHTAKTGSSSAIRRPPPTSCIARSSRGGRRRASFTSSPPPSRATKPRRSMSSTACWRRPPSSTHGSSRVAISTSAAMPRAWPRMSTPHSIRSSRRRAASLPKRPPLMSRN